MASAGRSRSLLGPAFVLAIAVGIGAIALAAWWTHRPAADAEQRFAELMSSAKTYLDTGNPARAIEVLQQARAMNPSNPDVHVNLAIAHLAANQPALAASHATEAAHLEPASGAGNYLLGCALLRQNQYSNAVQVLQMAKDADRTVNAVSFQLGRAYAGWGLFQDAADQLTEVVQFETNHPSAYYLLSQALTRLGQRAQAAEALASHQKVNAGRQMAADNPGLYERCVYTAPRSQPTLEQPDKDGIRLRFADATAAALGAEAARLRGPIATVDVNRRAWNDLVALGDGGLRLLWNSNAVFAARTDPIAVPEIGTPSHLLVGDINNDRYDDLVLEGTSGMAVFRAATNGMVSDATRISNLGSVPAKAGALVDHDFTGKLGLAAITPRGGLRLFRGFGNLAFRELPATSGVPADITGATGVLVDDWNNDDLPDLILTRASQAPLVLHNQRGGGFSSSNQPPDWPVASAVATGDLNNDLRTDIALLSEKTVDVYLGGLREPRRLAARDHRLRSVRFVDYDNDGWQDIIGWGPGGIRVWRNRGRLGFDDRTTDCGLAGLPGVSHLLAADFDQDGDPDLMAALEGGGLRFLRNEGGNQNASIRLRLIGNRSNASGLGTRVEVSGGSWRTIRSVQQLPVEIGVGKRTRLDSVTVRWFDTHLPSVDVSVEPKVVLNLVELTVPTGSCPYLYAWDGHGFRFVTDLLGAAPVGLPVAPRRYIEADPEEIVRIGTSAEFPARDGRHVVQVTEELREILYLDSAQLIAVDHPPDVEVHSTSKLLPGRPFPAHRLVGLHRPVGLRSATTLEGMDVTEALKASDRQRVSPPAPHGEAFRGLAVPHGVILDFGPIDTTDSLVLLLDGWLRFGGGMANIAASHREDFGFPFPTLEAEFGNGEWKRVDVQVGAPAGKTKAIVADLTGRLPAGTRRLRLTQAFEIHWDRIALMRPAPARVWNEHALKADRADLHARGYSAFADLPWTEPLTPVYGKLLPTANWRSTPSGWATRYGDVRELVGEQDNGLAIIAGGDELTLGFATGGLPNPAPGWQRTFFLRTVGWDKDADYHVAAGTTIEPLPWTGMDDQQHGVEPRPAFPSDALHSRYNTRWVGPRPMANRAAGR